MHSAALPPGYRLEEFEIVRVLGSGGFGITYLADDMQLRQQVAIKEYFPSGHATRTAASRVAPITGAREVFDWGYKRFLDEARVLLSFRHPNVVGGRRYFKGNGTAYLVMDYVEGESLAAILDSRGPLPVHEWRMWLDRLLDGLEHVHSTGYLHRDISPRNILIRKNSEPVLIDFGSARIAAGERTRTVVLTEAYAPIEQHSRKAKQASFTDIYSLAAVSYRVLTGEAPPSATDRAVEDEYVPLVQRIAHAQDWMGAVDRALALLPKDRPQSVTEWLSELNAATATMCMFRAVAEEPRPGPIVRLLEQSADLPLRSNLCDKLLHIAALQNLNPQVLTVLLDRGADVRATDRHGETALHIASRYNPNPAVVAVLLDRGADIHATASNGNTPLHVAAEWNPNAAVLAILLDRGADVHSVHTTDGEPAALLAARHNTNPNVLALLLDRGADVTWGDPHDCTTLLDEARAHNPNPDVIALLLERSQQRSKSKPTARSLTDFLLEEHGGYEVTDDRFNDDAEHEAYIEHEARAYNSDLPLGARQMWDFMAEGYDAGDDESEFAAGDALDRGAD